jgi:hypothetical protein
LTANQAGDGNYNAAPQVTLDVAIAKASQSITNFAATPASPVYSVGGTFALSATAGASSSPLVFASTTSGGCTVAGATVSIVAAGTCALTANQAGDGNYDAAPQVTLDVAIAKADQFITNVAANPATPLFHPGGTFSVSATAGASGNPVTFASSTSGICAVSGTTVTMLAPGTCGLVASEAGNGNYNDAQSVTLDVLLAQHTVTAATASPGGTIAPPTQQVTDGETANFTVTPAPGYVAHLSGDTCSVMPLGNNAWQSSAIGADCHVTATFDDRIFANGFEQ